MAIRFGFFSLCRPRGLTFYLLRRTPNKNGQQTQPASPPPPSPPSTLAAAAAAAAPVAAPPPSSSSPLSPPPPPAPLDRAEARAAAARAASAAQSAWDEARAAAAAAGRPAAPALGSLLVEPSWRGALARVVPGVSSAAPPSAAPAPRPPPNAAAAPAPPPPPNAAAALQAFLEGEWASPVPVFPPPWQIFRALNGVPLASARVVVIGQDPYHGPGQAEGLAFSVPRGQAVPPSLRNIHKELLSDVGAGRPGHGSLAKWAEQGVLLLNATLTVRRGQANSHQGRGWDAVTDAAVAALLQRREPAVFLLWGKFAERKVEGACRKGLWNERHVILRAPHPSGLSASRGFFGCRHFSKCNEALVGMGGEPIDWDLSKEE